MGGVAFTTAAAQAYSSQPAATDVGTAGTAVSIAFTLARTESQRCVVLAAATAAPANAAAITAGTGAVGTSPAAASATATQSTTISYTGLSAATDYKIYCATASGVLSTATGVAFTTAADTTTTTTTSAPTSAPATTAAPTSAPAKAAVDAGVRITSNKMGILIAFLALFFIH